MKQQLELLCEVATSIRGASLIANRLIKRGEVVISLKNLKHQTMRTYQTIQVRDNYHVVEDFLAKLNHSCDPTVFVDTSAGLCVAIRDIEIGEELNFFYPSTETEMAEPFECKCRASNCIKYVKGALDLPLHLLIGRQLAPHVAKALAAKYIKYTA